MKSYEIKYKQIMGEIDILLSDKSIIRKHKENLFDCTISGELLYYSINARNEDILYLTEKYKIEYTKLEDGIQHIYSFYDTIEGEIESLLGAKLEEYNQLLRKYKQISGENLVLKMLK